MFPFESDREDRPWLLLLASIALLEALAVFVFSWYAAGGHFMLPLDDPYIHLQYARSIAGGHPLAYSTGMLPSGGMTSPLYVLLFVPAMVVGFGGAKGAFLTFLLGAGLWALLPIWVYQLTKRLTNCLCGVIAGGLVLANGHLLWNFLSGMETGLFAAMLVATVLSAVCWWNGERPWSRVVLYVMLALLPLVRPEAAVIIVIAIAVVLIRKGEHPRLSVPILMLCFVPFALWLLLLNFGTGDWRPAGLVVKGMSGNPYLSVTDKLGIAAETLEGIVGRFYLNTVPDPVYARFKGTETMPYVPIGLGVMALLGAAFLLVGEWRVGRFGGGTFLSLCWIGGLVTLCASLLPFIHQQRYLAPYTPLAIVLAMVALRRLGQLFQQLEEITIKAAGLALLLVSLPSVPFWMAEHGRNSRDIYAILRQATFTLSAEEGPVAITDAGVLAYYTNRPVYDLVGLGSSEFTASVQHGEGSTLEALSRIHETRRPESLVTYREWFGPNFPVGDADWLIAVPRVSITSGNVLGSYPFDWKSIARGDVAPVATSGTLVLAVDVADLKSESSASYAPKYGIYDYDRRAWPQPLSPIGSFIRPATIVPDPLSTGTLTLEKEGPAVDGGRLVQSDGFLFVPGEFPADVTLVARLSRTGALPSATSVTVRAISRATGAEASDVLELPAEGLADIRLPMGDLFDRAGGETAASAPAPLRGWNITISAIPANTSFESYHYWLLEGDPALTGARGDL